MSDFSPSLRIELISNGDQSGTWGTTTNTNLGTIIESAIAGYVQVTTVAQKQALTAVDGAADQARNMTLWLDTNTGAAFEVYTPPEPKLYVVYNASDYAVTIYNWDGSVYPGTLTPAGVGTTIPAGKTMTIWSDGFDFDPQNTHIIGTVVGNVTGNVTGNLTGNVTGNATSATTATTAATANALNISNNYTINNRVILNVSGQSFYGEAVGDIGCLSTTGGWLFRSDNSGNFTATANVTAYSDERLKTDWRGLPADFVERLAKVKHGTYTRIDSGERQAGSSAQDWQKLLPEVVMTANDEQGTLSLAYGNAALVAAIKLAEKVVELEARLAKLEA